MFFENLEIDITKRLSTKFGDSVDVEVEPETESGNVVPFKKGRVSVMFDQSEFEKQGSTSYISQHETARLAIIIRARVLRGPTGVYTIAENVRRYIAGFAPPNWSKIWLIKFALVRRENNLWEYALLVGSKSMIVEETAPETGPKLVTGTAEYNDNNYN